VAYTNIEGIEQVGAPVSIFHVIHPPIRYHSYVSLMSSIINLEPSIY
jgi:hypothetical protein